MTGAHGIPQIICIANHSYLLSPAKRHSLLIRHQYKRHLITKLSRGMRAEELIPSLFQGELRNAPRTATGSLQDTCGLCLHIGSHGGRWPVKAAAGASTCASWTSSATMCCTFSTRRSRFCQRCIETLNALQPVTAHHPVRSPWDLHHKGQCQWKCNVRFTSRNDGRQDKTYSILNTRSLMLSRRWSCKPCYAVRKGLNDC